MNSESSRCRRGLAAFGSAVPVVLLCASARAADPAPSRAEGGAPSAAFPSAPADTKAAATTAPAETTSAPNSASTTAPLQSAPVQSAAVQPAPVQPAPKAPSEASFPAPPIANEDDEEDQDTASARLSEHERIHIDRNPGWSLGLDGYGGLALLNTSDDVRAHAFGGGLARVRWGYVQAGALLEGSDRALDNWRTIAGFLGAFLPFEHWVDLDASLLLGSRRYTDPDPRYGVGGYSISTPTLGLRLGFSDRTSRRRLGLRLGAALLASFDLKSANARFSYLVSDSTSAPVFVTGATRVGGASIGLAVFIGFDVAETTER